MNAIFSPVISASLSPNTEIDDVIKALGVLVSPWNWWKGRDTRKVTQWFKAYSRGSTVSLFNSGRSSLLAILYAFDIGTSDEVIVQAFTCVAVPNAVLWAKATPVYADIDASYNLDPNDVEKKITLHTKAIIIQHTFGVPADMSALLALAKKHNLFIIEDCAHALGATYKGKKLGLLGDASFYSFGRDKAISSVWGGAAVIHRPHTKQGEKLAAFHKSIPHPGMFWIFQQLLHPVAFSIVLPLYSMGVGKVLLVILQKLRLLSIPVYPEEKYGRRPSDFPAQYPNALAALLLLQLTKLDRYTRQRRLSAKLYTDALVKAKTKVIPSYAENASYLRYPILVEDPESYILAAKKHGILLGNWYHNVIDPAGVDFRALGYTAGSCPKAEATARYILNLPTRIDSHAVKRITALFQI